MQAESDANAANQPAAPKVAHQRFGMPGALATALVIAVVVVVADQLTKAAITARYGPCGSTAFVPVLGSHAGFSYVCNTGTAFSRFQDTPLVWLPVLVAVVAVVWLWVRSLSTPHLLQQIAFGLILGGAVGNVIDRARLGYVVDFVDVRWSQTLRFYVFNVADSSITIGVILLALAFWHAETTRSTA
ncbi:MAG: signal peptidase II [Thermomicrobiales bacterium]|jgi:signal peptidase II|nr:signal peptidase II [Thermomicrobiales bacterium]